MGIVGSIEEKVKIHYGIYNHYTNKSNTATDANTKEKYLGLANDEKALIDKLTP